MPWSTLSTIRAHGCDSLRDDPRLEESAPEQASHQNAKVDQAVIQPSVNGRWTPGSVLKEDADYLILGLEE